MLRVLIVCYRPPKHLIKMSKADNNKCEGFSSSSDHPPDSLEENKRRRKIIVSPPAPSSCGLSRLTTHVLSEVSLMWLEELSRPEFTG